MGRVAGPLPGPALTVQAAERKGQVRQARFVESCLVAVVLGLSLLAPPPSLGGALQEFEPAPAGRRAEGAVASRAAEAREERDFLLH
jgi:hypothetical protein